MKKFLSDNSLSVALFFLFALTFIGLTITGFYYQNQELKDHHQNPQSLIQFITSGSYVEAVFENWESEFLQMGALVVLTIWFVQKGAVESKNPHGKIFNTMSRHSIISGASWGGKGRAASEAIYANSLSLALFGLFFLSFGLHAFGGTAAANEEARWHGGEQQTVFEYVASSQFWFESFQNWQSEFLSVGVLLVLSVFLRQRHSAESKPVGALNSKTGG